MMASGPASTWNLPMGGGADPGALGIFKNYPSPNTDTQGTAWTIEVSFAAPAPAKLDTSFRLDYKLTRVAIRACL
jgi:hypothetical protein